jgi:threonine dehydrogenase-like Zn-dependent dehydrogenase
VYTYGYNDSGGQRRHAFDTAIDLVRRRKIDLGSLVTHRFALEDYRRMIEVNLNKAKHKAVKTVVTFD